MTLPQQQFKRRAYSVASYKIHKLYECILARLRSNGELEGQLIVTRLQSIMILARL